VELQQESENRAAPLRQRQAIETKLREPPHGIGFAQACAGRPEPFESGFSG
jgi:hypothetical protein